MTSIQNVVSDDRCENSSDTEHTFNFKRKSKPMDLLDSDSDRSEDLTSKILTDSAIDNKDDSVIGFSIQPKSRIKSIYNGSDSDSSTSSSQTTQTNSRVSIKKANLKSKFNLLLKKNKVNGKEDIDENVLRDNFEKSSSDTDENSYSIENIRKIHKARKSFPKTTLYDPDTSDEGNTEIEPMTKKLKEKSIKVTLSKPEKMMTSKQAMENMQRIKSESNRMLREKEVSLPYHRPRALSLKDILHKKKLTITVDGKTLPIKMNKEQLQQYAKMLEERQKEVIQLCKSDSENEDESHQADHNENQKMNQTSEHNTKATVDVFPVVKCNENLDNTTKDPEDGTNEASKNPKEITFNTHTLIDPAYSTDNMDNIITEIKDIKSNTNLRSDTDSQLLHFGSDKPNKNDICMHLVPNSVLPPEDNTNATEITTVDQSDDLISDTNNSSLQNLHNLLSKNVEMSEVQTKLGKHSDGSESNLEATFSDNDLNYDEIDMLIENAEIIKDCQNSPLLVTEKKSLNMKPKLTGGPGMVIDLDNTTDTGMSKKISGVELFKERFALFTNLKTPEELERQRDKKTKPGLQFLKLKQELEEEMAVQRSLEWSKREQENQLHKEVGLEESDETDISKLEEKLLDDEPENYESSESEDVDENDCDMEDRPRKRNPMVDDEAEESDVEDGKLEEVDDVYSSEHESDDSDVESSESEIEEVKPRKNRILKAFEDSDEEEVTDNARNKDDILLKKDNSINISEKDDLISKTTTQDDDIQLAQLHKSFSEDLFSTQESGNAVIEKNDIKLSNNTCSENPLGTQTFSILHGTQDEFEIDKSQHEFENLKAIANAIPVSSTQNATDSEISKTQGFGDDVLALCTGNFFNNEFVTQAEKNGNNDNKSYSCSDDFNSQINLPQTEEIASLDIKSSADDINQEASITKEDEVKSCTILKSILNELDTPEFDGQKFFSNTKDTAKRKEGNIQSKKNIIIDTDDEEDVTVESKEKNFKKKTKKKRHERRALQISDDEDETIIEEHEHDSEKDDEKRLVEYDSEENEVEIAPQAKKKQKTTDFFEEEAELTSEDEWVGSGDEDEANLDVMEREEGDDEVFHQGKLQRELGQLHMRDVMDQDKREVRIIQELLFEDADLGDGHRQRKFRWKNMDGVDGDDNIITTFGESQEEDFENEAEWRKERHKREVFLRQMRKNDVDDINDLEISTTILKSNLNTSSDIEKSSIIVEKRVCKDIPSPRKPLGVFQPNYHGSLLSKGESSLARLAALATPLNTDEDAPKTGLGKGKRNFVFSTLSQNEDVVQVTKRKADSTEDSPRLIKKLKNNNKKAFKSSLLDHLNSEIDI